MLDDLDKISWHKLTHAYGSAEDVPPLLQALRTAQPGQHGEESPLWCLFGNIWHQGTVYEATAYAVPFLIELAAEPQTPDRMGILALLHAIAYGSSYLEVHEPIIGGPISDQDKAQERLWVDAARKAVEAGFDVFMSIDISGRAR